MEHRLVLPSPVGELTLTEENGALTGLYFGARPGGEEGPSPLLEEAARQLRAYFAGQRQAFSLPLALRGTAFQLQVWQALQTIPYGEVRTYGEIARAIGKPKACRAVGMANHNNPSPSSCPATGWWGRTAPSPATAGAWRPRSFCWRWSRTAAHLNIDIERRLGRGTNPPAFSVQIAALPRARGRVTVGKDFAPRGQEERTVPMRKTNVSHTITRRETAR